MFYLTPAYFSASFKANYNGILAIVVTCCPERLLLAYKAEFLDFEQGSLLLGGRQILEWFYF
jgi:hypothetical protein